MWPPWARRAVRRTDEYVRSREPATVGVPLVVPVEVSLVVPVVVPVDAPLEVPLEVPVAAAVVPDLALVMLGLPVAGPVVLLEPAGLS
jgi:hypothetical protein